MAGEDVRREVLTDVAGRPQCDCRRPRPIVYKCTEDGVFCECGGCRGVLAKYRVFDENLQPYEEPRGDRPVFEPSPPGGW